MPMFRAAFTSLFVPDGVADWTSPDGPQRRSSLLLGIVPLHPTEVAAIQPTMSSSLHPSIHPTQSSCFSRIASSSDGPPPPESSSSFTPSSAGRDPSFSHATAHLEHTRLVRNSSTRTTVAYCWSWCRSFLAARSQPLAVALACDASHHGVMHSCRPLSCSTRRQGGAAREVHGPRHGSGSTSVAGQVECSCRGCRSQSRGLPHASRPVLVRLQAPQPCAQGPLLASPQRRASLKASARHAASRRKHPFPMGARAGTPLLR